MAALALGFDDPYDLTDADLAQVKDWYIEHKAQIRAFYLDETDFFDLYQSGDIVAGFGYKGYDVAWRSRARRSRSLPRRRVPSRGRADTRSGRMRQNLDGAIRCSIGSWHRRRKPCTRRS